MPEWKDFIPELVCLGVDGILCAALYAGYSGATKIAQDLMNAQEVNIDSSLKNQIDTSTYVQTRKDSTFIPYAVIRGVVTPMGRTVASAYSPEVQNGVVQHVVFTEHKRNLSRTGFWIDSERVMHQYINETPFCLKHFQESSYSLSKPRVEVCDWADATKIDLDTIHDKFEPGPNTVGAHLLGWFQGDLHKGTQVTENMLLKGTTLTAVGEIVNSPVGIQIKPPADGKPFFLVRSSIQSLIKDYEGAKESYRLTLQVFTVIGLIIAGVGIYRYWNKRKQELVDAANVDTIDQIISNRENRPARENLPENIQCVVCLSAEREVILLPCGHVCVCADCGRQLISIPQGCPVCRHTIDSIHQAFVS